MGKRYLLKPYFSSLDSLSFETHFKLNLGLLCIDYTISSNNGIDDLVLPKLVEVKRENDLWKSTCFECFLFYPEGDYYELNISPAGGWNSYAFTSYRKGMKVDDNMTITHLSSSISNYEFHMETCFQYADKRYPSSIQLCSVLEKHNEKQLNYWAIKHNDDKPDFHLQKLSSEYRWD